MDTNNQLIRQSAEIGSPESNRGPELVTSQAGPPQGFWKQIADFFRLNVGLVPLRLAEQYAEAEVEKKDALVETIRVKNQVTMLKAKQEYESAVAEERRRDKVLEQDLERTKAEIEALKVETEVKRVRIKAEKHQIRKQELELRQQERALRDTDRKSNSNRSALPPPRGEP